MAELVLSRIHDCTAVLTLDRPDKRNALSRRLIAELTEAFAEAEANPAVRAIILTGNGPAFCAGMDLDELRGTLTATQDKIWDDALKLSALFERIYHSDKPTIAAVNGSAVAGGAGLMTVCDLAVVVAGAKFGYPEVRRGLVAAMVLPHLLRLVGERAARRMLLTGELIDADIAFRIGLVNAVVADDKLMPYAHGWCASLREGGPEALATTKRLLRACSRQSLGVDELAKASAEPRLGAECHEGLKAFFEKRPAPWATP
jgi:methylglutaconyl-CoA hydratase